MSASREKKDRQDLFSTGISEKERKNQKEAAEKHRKTVMYTIIGIICVIAVTILLIWNSGIVQRGRTVLTVGDTNYTAADVNYYYYSAYNQEYYYSKNYSAYGLTSFDYNLTPEEQTYTDEETGETMTYQDYFLNTAENNLKQVTAVVNAANEAGYTLSQEGKDSVQESIDSLKSTAISNGYTYSGYLKLYYGEYMSTSAYKECLTRAQLVSEYYSTYSDSLTYDDAALNSYYDENAADLDTYDYSYLAFNATVEAETDADGNEITMTEDEQAAALEEAKTTAKASADAVLAAIQSGTSVDDLITEYTPSSSNATASSVGSSLSSAYKDWMTDSSRTAGDSDIVEYSASDTSYIYYVLVFNGRTLDTTPTVNIRNILIKADLPEDDASTTDVDESATPTDEAMATAKTTAENLLQKWKDDGDQTAESFATLATEKSADTSSNTNGGLYENVADGKLSDLNDWIMDSSRQPGDTTIIESTQSGNLGWQIVYFDSYANPVWMNTAESSLRSTDLDTWLTGLTDALTTTRTDYFASMVG